MLLRRVLHVWAAWLVGGLLALVLAVGGWGASSSTGTPADTGFTQTQTAQSYAVTLAVSPAKFGTNTFQVTVKTAQGQAVSGATVKLQPTDAPGTYCGQSDLAMSGHWQVIVDVAPPHAEPLLPFNFRFSATC
jgi:hypothetical protein